MKTISAGIRRRPSLANGVLALIAVVASSQAASAALLIDGFTTPQTVGVGGVISSAFDATLAPEALGGERDIEVTRTSPSGSITVDVFMSSVEYAASFSAQGNARIVWDGADGSALIDPIGLGGLDLTQAGANDRFFFDAGSDLGTMFYLTVFDSVGGTHQTGVNIAPGFVIANYALPFSLFPGVDFSQVRAVALDMAGPTTGVDSIILGNFAVVPETKPWLAAAALAGVLGVSALRRRSANLRG